MDIMKNINGEMTLHQMVVSLPEVWTNILGEIETPSDDGRQLYTAMTEGNLIGASDGSIRVVYNGDKKGGLAYSLQDWNMDEDKICREAGTLLTCTLKICFCVCLFSFCV